MTDPCIHGFRTEECTSCRTCPHGLVTSRCGRCIRASSTPAGRKALLVAHGDHPSEERSGFEIVYVPELSGWQVRSDDIATSEESYRSIFLARKAADDLASAASARESKQAAEG
jgi:hypothetical protein